MKINQINNVYYHNHLSAPKKKNAIAGTQQRNINFQGKVGKILGGTLGVVTIIATGGAALPFMSLAAAAGTAATVATGVISGHVAEEALKKAAKK